jgi:hypothetical protein
VYSANPVIVQSQVTYSGVNALTYQVSVDGVSKMSGTLPPSSAAVSTYISFTNSYTVGNHSVQFAVADGFGVANCAIPLVVQDTNPPTITCSPNLVLQTELGKSNAVVNYPAPTVTDDFGIDNLTIVCSPPSGSIFPLGMTTVNCTATDLGGNSASCSFQVNVIDSEPPSITCPSDKIVSTDPRTNGAIVTFVLLATDNVGVVSQGCVPASGSFFPLGTTIVNCFASDAAGLTARCSFNVTVRDTEPPSIVCPTNRIVSTDPRTNGAVVNFVLLATDNVGVVSQGCEPASGAFFPLGTTTVNCFASDAAGLTAHCSFTVTVRDTEPPQIFCIATNLVQSMDLHRSNAVVNYTLPNATDNGPSVTVVCTPPSGSVFHAGTNAVNCVATDAAGNTASCGFKIVIIDTEPPQISCTNLVRNADLGTCSSSNVVYSYSVSDNVLLGLHVDCVPPSGATFGRGATLVTCTATDGAGNTSTCTFSVMVNDNQMPALTLPANMIVNNDPGLCSAVVRFSATATDNCTASPLVVCTPASGAVFPVGLTTVLCRAMDESSNVVTGSFTITVVDAEAPRLTCPADIRVPSDPGKMTAVVNFNLNGSAVDNCGAVTVTSLPASGSTFQMGTNLVLVTARDSAGNSNTCTFRVIVSDNEPPKITCPLDMLASNTPGLCSVPIIYSVTVTDNMPGTTYVCQPASGSLFPVGTNTVNCTATDEFGNTAQCSFRVVVRDVDKPLLQLVGSGNMTIECHSRFTDPGATASDNCGGNLNSAIKVTGSVDANTPGTYTLNYSVTDASGNSASVSRTVRVVDSQPPILTLLGQNPYRVECGKTYVEPGATAADACAGDLTSAILISGSVDPKAPGTYTITYAVTDPSGNSVTNTRLVEVFSGLTDLGDLYPIAISKASLTNASVGDVLANILNGTQSGNFGWLTWSGAGDANALSASLTPPGNSSTYINPNNSADHVLSVGDWVRGNSGLSNSKNVRDGLNALKAIDITVPIYDIASGSGANAMYHIVSFARFRITAYDLTGQNKISARFLGYVSCTCNGNDLMSMSLQSSINEGSVAAGDFIWFNGAVQVSGLGTKPVKIRLVNQTITSADFSLSVSNASVLFDPAATNATTDFIKGEWITRVPITSSNGNVFISGLPYKLPAAMSGNNKLAWNGTFVSDTPDVTVSWKWAASAYSDLSWDGAALGVKPLDNAMLSAYKNTDAAGTPEKYKGKFLTAGKGGTAFVGAYSGVGSVSACHGADGQTLIIPQAITVQSAGAGKHSISWTTKPGKSYKVQYKNKLSDTNWTDLTSSITATDATTAAIDGTAGAAQQRYYRIVLLP